MQTLQQEIETILDEHFPTGLPPSRVEEAIKRGYCRVVDACVDDPVEPLSAVSN
jgi:hypothetical protein